MTTPQHLQQRKAQASIDIVLYTELKAASNSANEIIRYNHLIKKCHELYAELEEVIKLLR